MYLNSLVRPYLDIQESLYTNILLTGGNTLFPNMKDRVEADLRSLVPEEYTVNVFMPKEYAHISPHPTHVHFCVEASNVFNSPILSAWYGGSVFAQDDSYNKYVVTLQEYQEHGAFICKRKFYL